VALVGLFEAYIVWFCVQPDVIAYFEGRTRARNELARR
jgi:hypothetical protein